MTGQRNSASPARAEQREAAPRPLRMALAGNPNCGKSSLFNALTGASQHVANYPGVTVERRWGAFTLEGAKIELVDLPGTYSLSSFTPEERIAQEELALGHDVVVVVADSTNLKRNLVLLAQVMLTGAKTVLCLNMADEARAAGQRLDLVQMERLLGIPIVETIAHKGKGVAELRAAIRAALAAPTETSESGGARERRLVLGERLDRTVSTLEPLISDSLAGKLSKRWAAIKLLLDDTEYVHRAEANQADAFALEAARALRARIEREVGDDISLCVTQAWFGFVDGLLREVLAQPPRADARARSDKIDQVVAHPLLGLPIFAIVLYAIFWLTFTLGEAPMGWFESSFDWLRGAVSGLWPEGSTSLLRSLICDGVIAGVGGVLVFLPNILLLFLGLAFLEDTGYLARAAFLMDRAMHRFGLHGKSFIPMMTGFGCSVPGIMATRTLENERDRLTTMLVLPLMSCGARLPIWMLLIPAFFAPSLRAPILFGVYAFGVALALLLALLLRRSLLAGDDAPFVMELPPYRMPTMRGTLRKMAERGQIYLRKAGTLILALSILLWAATTFPRPAPSTAGAPPSEVQALENSFAGRTGRALEPLFRPLGFDWKIVTAMLGAFAAKEVFVAQMGIVNAVSTERATESPESPEPKSPEEEERGGALGAALARDYSSATGLSLILFLLIGSPCMATFAITRRESGSLRWALLQFCGLTVLAWLVSFAAYQLGSLLLS